MKWLPVWLLAVTVPASPVDGTRSSRPIADGFGKGAYPFGSVSLASGTSCHEPTYTDEARAAGIEGTVVVEVVVLANGTPTDARILKSLDPALDQRALDTIRGCHLIPGETSPGHAVASVGRVTVVFRLHRPGRVPGQDTVQSEADQKFAGDAYLGDAQGITAPRILVQPEPRYTSEAMRAKIQGDVTMDAVIGVDGRVRAVRILTSLDDRYGLDREAMDTAGKWRFAPATLNGVAVPVVVKLVMTFRLH